MRYVLVAALLIGSMLGVIGWLQTLNGSSEPRDGARAVRASSETATSVPNTPGLGLGRTGLSACIESATPANPAIFVETANKIADELEARQGSAPDWLRGATAVAGCPPLAPFVSPAQLPSKHKLHIRVSETWHPAAGVRPYIKGSTETYGMGDACTDETILLTVPSLDPDVLFDAVVGGLGLYGAVLPPHWTPPWNSEPDYRATQAFQTREADHSMR